MKVNDILLIFDGGGGAEGGIEFSGAIDHVGDAAGRGGALHVDVPDREKDGDAMAHDRIEHFVDDFDDVTIGGRDDQLRVGGDVALRIAKKIKNEEAEKNEESRRAISSRE